jgi:hypothetical protein
MPTLDVWLNPRQIVVLAPTPMTPRGAIEDPGNWKFIGTVELTPPLEVHDA